VTDCFGDFEFRNVKKGKHQISYVSAGYQPESKSFGLDDGNVSGIMRNILHAKRQSALRQDARRIYIPEPPLLGAWPARIQARTVRMVAR